MISVAYWSRSSSVDRGEVVDQLLKPVGEAQPQQGALVSERTVGHPPALVERADQVLGGHPRVAEEHLVEVEVVAVADGCERPAHHTRRCRWGSAAR